MITNIENPKRPLLTAFLSYSNQDRPLVIPLIEGLRKARIEVIDFCEDEPFGAYVDNWIETKIAESDCVIIIISTNSLTHPDWIEKEAGLAINLLTENGRLHPTIVPIKLNCTSEAETLKFQPRNFYTGENYGPSITWSDIHCMMPDRDGMEETISRFVKLLSPKTLFITNPEDPNQKKLFDDAIKLYEDLLPDERERDTEQDIAEWISESWEEDGEIDKNCEWLHSLAVHHISGKVIGMFWCSVHKTTGIGFVAFWGLLAAHRSYGRGIRFAREVITMIKKSVPNIRALLFAAERVEWKILDKFLMDALKIWKQHSGQRKIELNFYSKLSKPLNDQPSALTQTLKLASKKKREAVIDQLRRYRRFALYANGANYNKEFEREGANFLAFTKQQNASNRSHPQEIMADFVQPPIREPVIPSNDCHLWLFALIFDDHELTPVEAIDWIYDIFLKDSHGRGKSELAGWNDYMLEFKKLRRDAFAEQAELSHLRLRDSFAPYNMLLSEVKKYWLHQKVLDETEGRWDIHL